MAVSLTIYVESIQRNSQLAHNALEAASPLAKVPFCGDWPASELRDHISGVFAFWTHQLRQADASESGFPEEARSRYVRPIQDAAADIVQLLSAAEPEQPCWNWSGSNMTAGWALRRMAHEIAVHRVDAQGTLGPNAVTPIAQELAVDGIDELLDVHVGAADAIADPNAPLLEIQTPTKSWTVAVGSQAVRSSGVATAKVSGSASDVLLNLWNRRYGAQISGDEAVMHAWRSLPVFT